MVFVLPQYTLAFSFGNADMRELTCSEDEAIAVGRVLLRNGAEVHMRPQRTQDEELHRFSKRCDKETDG